MTISLQHKLLFLVGCIGSRLLLTFAAFKLGQLQSSWLPILGLLTLTMSLGFFVIYAFGLRKTGVETGGEKIWWNDLRPLHGTLYLLFSILAVLKNPHAYVVLLLDTIIGLTAFTLHHNLL